jgi:hypothetical protein
MLYGYARTSPDDPRLVAQRAALTDAGCTQIFEERGSRTRNRPAPRAGAASGDEFDTRTSAPIRSANSNEDNIKYWSRKFPPLCDPKLGRITGIERF